MRTPINASMDFLVKRCLARGVDKGEGERLSQQDLKWLIHQSISQKQLKKKINQVSKNDQASLVAVLAG